MSACTQTPISRLETRVLSRLAGFNLHTCENCGHDLRHQLGKEIPKEPETMHGQIWNCVECWTPRQWGDSWPADRSVRPALGCAHCQAVTRHAFSRVI